MTTSLHAVTRLFPAAVTPPRFQDSLVVVLGDVMLDRYVSGHAQRLSPEAPIPVLRPRARHATLGGAANVALNIATLGGRARLVGAVGPDPAAEELRARLADAGTIEARLIEAARPTTCKTRFLAGQHQLLRLDEEVAEPLADAEAAALLDLFARALEGAGAAVFSDYAKGVLCDGVLGAAIGLARAAGVPVIVDPKRLDFAAYAGATVITPNEAETRAATRIDPTEDDGAAEAGARALAATGGEAALITRSERGVTLVRRGRAPLHLPAEARAVADVSGAGDTLVATLALSLAAGAPLEDAAALANVAAGISVGKTGTAAVTRAELDGALLLAELVETDRKVVGLDEAVARATAWRREGRRVGFTNGCFDLIHPGHVRLLKSARAACDRLVVGLNTDASVRRLKGETRPVQNEAARATVMASLAPVDLVVLFGEETPIALIRALRPEVLVKGADYRIDQVVGGEDVRGWGGRVMLVDLEQGHSTTGIVRRMALTGAE